MKRGKKLLFYVFSVVFSLSFFIFFASGVKAANTFTYTCIDESTETACEGTPTDFYYRLDQVELEQGFSGNLVIPNSYTGSLGSGDVRAVGNGSYVISTLDAHVTIDEIVLPDTLYFIADGAFNNSAIDSIGNVTIPDSTRSIG